MRTRKQFLVGHFPPDWRVLFLEPFAFGRLNSFRPFRDGRVTYVTVPFLRGGTTSAAYNRAVSIPPMRRLLSKIATLWVKALLAALRVPSKRVFIVSNPYAADTVLAMKRDLLCYDYNDNPFQFPQTPDWVRGGLWELLRASDAVFVVSKHYLDMLAKEGVRNLHLLGNGVEYDHFARPAPEPAQMKGLSRPILLYTGRLGPLVDFDLLNELSRAFPRCTLVLIGPVDPVSRDALAPLAERPNVLWMEEKPYGDLPGYIQAADLCLAPFKFMHEHIVGINPNKIYQYLAAGRPVVSSYFHELGEHSGEIAFARSAAEFIEQVRICLENPPSEEILRRLASRNDWKNKADRMAEVILELLNAGGRPAESVRG